MGLLTLSGAGTRNRLLTSFWEEGSYRGKLYKTYTERWQWGDGGIIKSVAARPQVNGYGCTSASAKYEDGFATFVWEFETYEADNSAATYRMGNKEELSEIWEGSLSKAPITAHKKIGQWLGYKNKKTGKRYGRVVGGEVIWELEDPTGGGRTGLTPDGKVSTNINPFYGISDFYEVGAMSIVEEVRSKHDLLHIVSGLGTIDATDGPSNAPDGTRNWLYAGASATQIGNKFKVRKSWMMSGYGGWEPALYSAKYWSKSR